MKVCLLCENETDDLREKCPYCGGELKKRDKVNAAEILIEGVEAAAEIIMDIIT